MNVDRVAITQEDLAHFDKRIPGISAYLQGWADKARDASLEARTDPLTRLPNRLGLEEEMGHIMKQMAGINKRDPDKGKACTMVFIDTNDFGLINKAMGDAAGDIAIQTVGEYFDRTLRHEDFVARKGGDEFVIAMRCPEKDAEKRLQELKKDFNRKATRTFRRKLTELLKSQYEDIAPADLKQLVDQKMAEFQKKLAVKHENPGLEERPFSLSFSFGVREVSKDELQNLNLRDGATIASALSGMMSTADELMRSDKDAYRASMRDYTPGRQNARRARLLGDLSKDGNALS